MNPSTQAEANSGSQESDRKNPGSGTPSPSQTDAVPRNEERQTFANTCPPPPLSGAAASQTKAPAGKVASGPPRPDEVPPPKKYWGQGFTSTTESKVPEPPLEEDTDKSGSSSARAENESEPPKSWKYLLDLQKDPPDSETELIRHRFLCVRGGLLLVGPSGIGKSSLVMQLMISFALGMPCLGFEPVRALKILVIQAENDEHDLADMRDGVIAGLGLTQEQLHAAKEKMIIVTEESRRGMNLFEELIEPLLNEHKPDLLIIDPALAYIDGDSISGQDVGCFLRTQLNPLLAKYNCGLILVHHTNKPSTGKQGFDPAYLGSGSAEWTNWARAVLSLQKLKDGCFNLWAAKRGFRLKWSATGGERVIVKQIAHCKTHDRILWEEVPEEEVAKQEAATKARRPKPGKETLLSLVPVVGAISMNKLKLAAQDEGISRERFNGLILELIEDRALAEVFEKRAGRKDERLVRRLNT